MGKKLAVELRLDTLWGIKGDYSTGVTSQSEMITEEPVALSFEVTADTTANRSGESASTDDGITFVGFESTPLYFKAKLSIRRSCRRRCPGQENWYMWKRARRTAGNCIMPQKRMNGRNPVRIFRER